MAKDLQPAEVEYDDGLAPPPELPPLATSQAGTVAEAEALQQQNNVPDYFRGPWFHETYTDLDALDNQHEEWAWFTRSPAGGTIWGKDVRQVYVVGVPENTKSHATSNKGDTNGYEGDEALPDWWMGVGREDIPKLMVVSKIDPKTEKAKLDGFLETEWHKATRRAAIDKVKATKPKPADEEIAVAAYYIWEKDGQGPWQGHDPLGRGHRGIAEAECVRAVHRTMCRLRPGATRFILNLSPTRR